VIIANLLLLFVRALGRQLRYGRSLEIGYVSRSNPTTLDQELLKRYIVQNRHNYWAQDSIYTRYTMLNSSLLSVSKYFAYTNLFLELPVLYLGSLLD